MTSFDTNTLKADLPVRNADDPNPKAGPVLERIAAGDADAVSECLHRYTPMVRSLARAFGLGDADAEDAVQETLIDLWRSASRYDPQIASESTFVRVLAKRRIIDLCRRNDRSPETEPLSEESFSRLRDASLSPESRIEVARIRGALNELPSDKRRILQLAIWQGLSHAEIAESTGKALGTVKTTIRRGLNQIREQMLDGR
jgi:RNA polymerase sigma-70 factor (ECF subfamily)